MNTPSEIEVLVRMWLDLPVSSSINDDEVEDDHVPDALMLVDAIAALVPPGAARRVLTDLGELGASAIAQGLADALEELEALAAVEPPEVRPSAAHVAPGSCVLLGLPWLGAGRREVVAARAGKILHVFSASPCEVDILLGDEIREGGETWERGPESYWYAEWDPSSEEIRENLVGRHKLSCTLASTAEVPYVRLRNPRAGTLRKTSEPRSPTSLTRTANAGTVAVAYTKNRQFLVVKGPTGPEVLMRVGPKVGEQWHYEAVVGGDESSDTACQLIALGPAIASLSAVGRAAMGPAQISQGPASFGVNVHLRIIRSESGQTGFDTESEAFVATRHTRLVWSGATFGGLKAAMYEITSRES